MSALSVGSSAYCAEWQVEETTRRGIVGHLVADDFGRLSIVPSPRARPADVRRLANVERLLHAGREAARRKRLGDWVEAASQADWWEDVV